MNNFEFQSPTRIIFGKESHRRIGELVRPLASKVLLHYGTNSIKANGLYEQVTASLREARVEFVELSGVRPNPRLSLAEQGANLCRENGVDMILAVGGGSVIDSAKAIALGAPLRGDLWDEFYIQRRQPREVLPVATILTIPAAGSESSPNSVITNDLTQQKLGFGHPLLRPKFSIINPELFYTIPKAQIANGVCDMMCHIFERYFTRTLHTDLTDGLCESTLRVIMRHAPALVESPANYDAWAETALAGNIAHNGLLGMGREEDWASHKIEHELSALYDIAHGAGLAVVAPAWMRYVCGDDPCRMFVKFAVNVMRVDIAYGSESAAAERGIARLVEFFKSIGLPTSLRQLGIGDENFRLMADKAIASGGGTEIGSFRRLCAQDIVNIYSSAL